MVIYAVKIRIFRLISYFTVACQGCIIFSLSLHQGSNELCYMVSNMFQLCIISASNDGSFHDENGETI